MQKISVIIPYLNEGNEIVETIKSINSTADPNLVDVIAIDDCSKVPTDLSMFKNVKAIRNGQRMGVDWSRRLGVELAKDKYCLILDGHMRLMNDNWAKKMINYIDSYPKTLWCTICLGLGYGTLDPNKPKGRYYGAELKILSDQEKNRPCRNILENKWLTREPEDEETISCILGANYFFDKAWFLYCHLLKGLKSWGSSEFDMSVKSYLSGGDCRITKQVSIGHVFRENSPYTTQISSLYFNKAYLLKTIFPKELEDKLMALLPKDVNFTKAMDMISESKAEIESEKAYYQSIFKMSIYDLCKKLTIELPS